MNRETLGGIVMSVLAGVFVGVAIGILVAPRSGKETREIIVEKTGEIEKKAEELVGSARDKTEDIITKARTKMAHSKENQAGSSEA